MKLKALKRYPTPKFPTLEQMNCEPGLLAPVPRRWLSKPGFAALLGGGAMFRALLTPAEAAEVPPPVGPQPAQQQLSTAKTTATTEQQVQQASTVVAPLLAEAMAHDGRGAFGCVAVSPPTFLAESEAVELIRTELAAAGLVVREEVALGGIKVPKPGSSSSMVEEEKTNADGSISHIRRSREDGEEVPLQDGEQVFDLGAPEQGIYIEYLSSRDHEKWQGSSSSTVQRYNFPRLAEKIAVAWGQRQSAQPAVVGLFFDPLARVPSDRFGRRQVAADNLDPRLTRLRNAEARRAAEEDEERLPDKAKEKLRKQVQHFIAFLRQKELLKPPAPPAK